MTERDWQADWELTELSPISLVTRFGEPSLDVEKDLLVRKAFQLSEALRYWLQKEKEQEDMLRTMRRTLHDIFPTIAGHIISLVEAGKAGTNAYREWASVAQSVYQTLTIFQWGYE